MSEFKVNEVVCNRAGEMGVVLWATDLSFQVQWQDNKLDTFPQTAKSVLKVRKPFTLGDTATVEDYTVLTQQDTHYKKDVEPIDLIEAFDLDFCAGNVIKYVSRAKHKGNEKEDLRKAMYYLKRLIDGLEE